MSQNQTMKQIFGGDSEMAKMMRSHDWSQTALGCPTQWAQSLRTALSICLESRFPIVIYWGDDMSLLYNDAWRPILGLNKHPWALGRSGREVWAEIWDVIAPQLHQVFTTGQATWCDDLLLMMERSGYTEETYFTYSFSPIRIESGAVGGAFSAVTETTLRVLSERRMKTLRDLAAQVGLAKTVEQAFEAATQILSENSSDVPFALLYLLTPDGKQAQLCTSTPLAADTPASPSCIDLTQSNIASWNFASVVATGQIVLVEDLLQRFGRLPSGPWTIPPQQALVLPLRAIGQGQLAGLVVMGVSPCRILDENYQNFFEMAAGHIANAIANARAYEEECKRAEALAELDRAKTAFFSNVSHEFRRSCSRPVDELSGRSAKFISVSQQPNYNVRKFIYIETFVFWKVKS